MKNRNPIVAANWKMHSMPDGCLDCDAYVSTGHPDIVVFPNFIDLEKCISSGKLIVGGQYGRPESSGAFTGDVSMEELKGLGCAYVLCGHSERRQHHHESDEFIADQVAAAIEAGLIPILCIGETADERELGQAEETVKLQLTVVLEKIGSKLKAESCVLAYEPVWAIGSGKNATATEAQEMHSFIRSLLPVDLRVIYGGSVKPDNAAELIAQTDIDGFLVGGASLIPDEFKAIAETVKQTI